ncbi:PhoH family protein [Nonomuraea salmonea]|uniref:PhoH family protein n=1 Tax=Nonomuraea salmonea TaxID=46181 RepID=UPI002FEC690B
MVSLLGSRDELLRVIEGAFRADIHVRGNEITVTGSPDESGTVVRLFEELVEVLRSGGELTPDAVERSIAMLRMTSDRPAEVLSLDILSSRGRTIRPKTVNQKRYVDAIDDHTIVFGIGPAGTGKTYLAMAKAVRALQEKRVNRIILTRPAVEAGERLGFLPGTLYEKIDPYLRPLYDALHDMVDPDSIPKLMAAGTIEVAPLAYMRGRAQPVDSQVLTPDGWRAIGELEVGDLVVGSDGEPTPVLGGSIRRARRRSTGCPATTAPPCSPAKTTCGPSATARVSRGGCWRPSSCSASAGGSCRCSPRRSASPSVRCRWIRTRWASSSVTAGTSSRARAATTRQGAPAAP